MAGQPGKDGGECAGLAGRTRREIAPVATSHDFQWEDVRWPFGTLRCAHCRRTWPTLRKCRARAAT